MEHSLQKGFRLQLSFERKRFKDLEKLTASAELSLFDDVIIKSNIVKGQNKPRKTKTTKKPRILTVCKIIQ